MTPPAAGIVAPPDFGSGPGVRARIRDYRLGQLQRVLDAADGALRYEDAHAALVKLDGVGVPLRTLKEPPFAQLISAQTRRRGRVGELAGLPWRLTRLGPQRVAERTVEAETRLRAMRIDLPVAVDTVRAAGGEGGNIQRLWDFERAMSEHASDHGMAIAASMKALLVERRGSVAAQRELALSRAYHQLRQPAPSGQLG